MTRSFAAAAALVFLTTCPGPTSPSGDLAVGTWGGDNAAAIVSDTLHVHIGCTYGNAPRPTLTAGRFEVAGSYNITAYPLDRGVFHPAAFTGQVAGNVMTFTVTLSDTSVTLGPAQVTLGREPSMGPCPICRPPARRQGAIAKPWRNALRSLLND
jgi:hypothetical protein